MVFTPSSPNFVAAIEKIRIYAQLLRPIPAAIAALMGCVTLYVLNPELPAWKYVFTAGVLSLMNSAAFTINDYWDVDKDRIDHPERPLPSGRLSRSQVYRAALILFGSALLVSIALGAAPFLLVAICTILLWRYSHILLYNGILGNVVVAAIVAAILLLGSLVAHRPFALLYAIGFTFFYALAKEIIWDVHDCKGDRRLGITTIATSWGDRAAFFIAWALMGGLLISIPAALYWLPMSAPVLFAVFVLLTLVSWGVGMARFQSYRSMQSYRTLIRWGRISMVCGLIALLCTATPIS